MMKLFGSNGPWRTQLAIARVFRAVHYSPVTLSSSSSSSPRIESLYQKIWRCGDPSVSMVSLLDRWLEEGRHVKQTELQRLVKQLRKHRRYSQALQISEWMSDGMNYKLSSGDVAVRLDLIAKVRGVGEAERYFNSIPPSSRIDKIHGALLNSYAENNSLDKADDLFQKIRESGFLKLVLSYNVMLSLYSRMGQHEKLNMLLQEMENDGIKCDNYTYAIRLNALAVTSDIEGLEKLLTTIEADPQVSVDIHAYFVAAKGYVRVNLLEKALTTLRKAEQLIRTNGKRVDYEHLLTMYAAAGNKEEVYRIWDQYKNTGKVYNTGYLALLSSLVKLDDFDGVEKIFKEWESERTCFDNRIANLLISAYCKKGWFEKAFAYVEQLMSSGHEPEASVWQCLANQCCMDGQMAKAVESMKKAASAGGHTWVLNRPTLAACIEYLKRLGDRETAHGILESLRGRGALSIGSYNGLVDFLNSDKDSGALDAIETEKQNLMKKNIDVAIPPKVNGQNTAQQTE